MRKWDRYVNGIGFYWQSINVRKCHALQLDNNMGKPVKSFDQGNNVCFFEDSSFQWYIYYRICDDPVIPTSDGLPSYAFSWDLTLPSLSYLLLSIYTSVWRNSSADCLLHGRCWDDVWDLSKAGNESQGKSGARMKRVVHVSAWDVDYAKDTQFMISSSYTNLSDSLTSVYMAWRTLCYNMGRDFGRCSVCSLLHVSCLFSSIKYMKYLDRSSLRKMDLHEIAELPRMRQHVMNALKYMDLRVKK